ncbi:MAG: site-specific DNA-methyltransferase [Caulobacteraceae bacterium]|nr:site-specific DNA-methyltransferase [Caulobacteraceae bacterium]
MAILKEERIGGQRLILGDCREVMPLLGQFDAVVTDPPYGIGESAGKAKTRTSGLTSKRNGETRYVRDYGNKSWDATTADDEVEMARSIARRHIIFGGNYYNLPPTSCWLVWDKLNGANDFADCELAWTNIPKAVRRIPLLWNGCMRVERHIARVHPTQKPVALMEWCLGFLPDAVTILDPFMGSGTTLVACQRMGRSGTGIELDPQYFDIACKRVDEAARQPDLLIAAPAPQPVQEGLPL